MKTFILQALLLPYIGGILYSTGFPNIILPVNIITPIIGLIFLFININFKFKQKLRPLHHQLLAIAAFSLGVYSTGYYWIPYTMKEFGGLQEPLNYLLGLFFSIIIVPQFFAFVIINNFLIKLKLKSSPFSTNINLKIVLYSFLFVILENFTPQQFPIHIGHSYLSIAPYVKLSQIFGPYLYSFISYALVLSIVYYIKKQIFLKIPSIIFAIVLIISFLFPVKYLDNNSTKSINIRMVQANIGNFLKIKSETGEGLYSDEVLKSYEELSFKNSDLPIDLIIWPETSFPRAFNTDLAKLDTEFIPSNLKSIIAKSDSQFFIGIYDNSSTKKSNYQSTFNAAVHFSSTNEILNVYRKQKLIPFGEGLPFGPFNDYLSTFITNISYFAEGEKFPLFKTKDNISFASLICYEVLFSNFVTKNLNRLDKRPDFILNITNDSWYGDTIEPYQHLFLTHWRSLEHNLPLVRMTNTGISVVLYPDGSESKKLLPFKRGFLDVNLELKETGPTIYQKYGHLALILLISLISLLITFFSRNNRNKV